MISIRFLFVGGILSSLGLVSSPVRAADVAIDAKDFSNNLIRLWIGPKPPNSELKEGMLGIED